MNSTNATANGDWLSLPLYTVYIVQGCFSATGNLLIVLSIARYEALRNNKEYVIMCGLSLADCLGSAGTFCSGIYRIGLLSADQHNALKTVWECMLLPHNLFWSLSVQAQSLMLMVVSCDRYLAVRYPLHYICWTATYARRFVSIAFSYQAVGAVVCYYSAYANPAVLVPATCSIVSTIAPVAPSLYFKLFNLTFIMSPILSVFVYGLVMVILHKHFNNTVVSSNHPNEQYELKRQRKITTTLSISALCTFFLHVIPVTFALKLTSLGYVTVGFVFFSVTNFNIMANIFIYPLRHREILQAMKALGTCKHMPHQLKMWNPIGPPVEANHTHGGLKGRAAVVIPEKRTTTMVKAQTTRQLGNPGPSNAQL